jgi:hypothetical protein
VAVAPAGGQRQGVPQRMKARAAAGGSARQGCLACGRWGGWGTLVAPAEGQRQAAGGSQPTNAAAATSSAAGQSPDSAAAADPSTMRDAVLCRGRA